MRLIRFLALAALLASIAWCVTAPGYEPAIAIITSLSALIGTSLAQNRRERRAMQSQKISRNAVGVQAGRDVTIGDINTLKNQKRHAE